MPRANRFTIYDALEANGVFDANPANSFSRDKATGENLYKGPVAYPKMLYHPEGEEKIIVPGEVITTPLGAKMVGEQKELINRIVTSIAEDEEAQAEGWHDHPAKAIRARVELKIAQGNFNEKETATLLRAIPTMSSSTRIADLEAEIARLQALRESEKPKVEVKPQQPLQAKPGTNKIPPTIQPPPNDSSQPPA